MDGGRLWPATTVVANLTTEKITATHRCIIEGAWQAFGFRTTDFCHTTRWRIDHLPLTASPTAVLGCATDTLTETRNADIR